MLETSFTSYLGVAPYDGAGRAQVLLNSRRADSTDSSVPFLHTWRAVDERNTVEAYTTQPLDEAGFWKFDYSAAKHFVAGSLHVEQGKVISRDAHSIVFRLRRTG